MSNWSTGTNTIQEVDTNKNLTLQMLKVRKQGGGTEYFVRKNDVKLGAKHITQNGTYPASNDGKLGFSQVTVNVAGGNGSADSHGKPTGGDIKPGGAGSAVVGTDPETGNDVVVGVDEDGQLVNTPVPSGIKIVTPPTKTDYVYQEDMDYSGLVVKMINRDGTTFTDVGHPNGYLAVGELVLPVEKAPAASNPSNQYPEYQDSGTVTVASVGSASAAIGDVLGRMPDGYVDECGVVAAAKALVAQYPDCACIVHASQSYGPYEGWSPFDFYIFPDVVTGTSASLSPHECVKISTYGAYKSPGDPMRFVSYKQGTGFSPRFFEGDDGTYVSTLNAVCTGGTATIPVKWLNPYTGEEHQDTFEINSTPSTGSSSTTTGSSGTEGSGGGGSF